MPYIIHHPERIIPAYDETLYSFDELTDDAKDRATRRWIEENAAIRFDDESWEISQELDYVLDQLPDTPHMTHDKGGNLYLSVMCPEEWAIHPTGTLTDTGMCYSMDFAEAYNKHADEIDRLADILNDTDYDDPAYDDLCGDLCGAINAALEAVATAYNDDVNGEYDALFDGEAFRDGYCDEYLYDANGKEYLYDSLRPYISRHDD